jgi:pimeloyl-ACP methyl ester carboxylesterase
VFDEPSFISRLESADADELGDLLKRPSQDDEKALRSYFGDERYRRVRAKALKTAVRRGLGDPIGNVVVLHGIMGSELSSYSRAAAPMHLWVKVVQIMNGGLVKLRLGEDGRSASDPSIDVRPSGIMKRHYGDLLLTLAERWRVRAFWFDWRKDLRLAAAELEAHIKSNFDEDAPVHLVAHSMGGLVARTFAKAYPRRWDTMWDKNSKGRAGGRLIMLGTPNHGSFSVPQVITGVDALVRKLALLDLTHSRAELLDVFTSFPGLYQLLPSPLVNADLERLYEASTYPEQKVPQVLLDRAHGHHEFLAEVVDADRMVCVSGANQATFSGVRDFERLSSLDGYEISFEGDGRVSHKLGLLNSGRTVVPTYYVEVPHGELPADERVLNAVRDLLDSGQTGALDQRPPPIRGGLSRGRGTKREPHQAAEQQQERDLRELETIALGLRARVEDTRSTNGRSTFYSSSQERAIEEILTRGFLTWSDEELERGPKDAGFPPPEIEIRLEVGGIADIDESTVEDLPPDALAVGHYIGVQPQAAELTLDAAISAALPGQTGTEDGLLAQFGERGIIHGERGQIYFLPDPRVRGSVAKRLIAVVGMGYPGRFGVPELTVASRELCWSLGRMGRLHLATVLIGAGNNNIPAGEAINAWIRGVKHALTGSKADEGRRLQRITFVEEDPRKVGEIDEALWAAKKELEGRKRLIIKYERVRDTLGSRKLAELRAEARRRAMEAADLVLDSNVDGGTALQPTRVTLGLEGSTYRFGAITEDASLPERAVKLDPKLVRVANDELAAEWRPLMQQERGRLMEQLLVPDDLRPHLAGTAPLVMVLDSTTARIHWEMVAQGHAPVDWPSEGSARDDELARAFLGTSRGFTRQLMTGFAPAPQPPPPARRVLRVLIVADPARDAHLPGAEEEGVEIADLFDAFNSTWGPKSKSSVEVVALLGPSEASRTHVLRHLMLRSYDVLHFAGHCMYDEEDRERQGWIFGGGETPELLSPNELNRIDRIPKFVFSNACESGITPDRSEERNAALAPGFAESFFARGVANFVCTAWPVDDRAAREFALELYSRLLGLQRDPDRPGSFRCQRPEPMHVAMREARLAIFGSPGGARTWGAYQHYGNPFFRLFDARTIASDEAPRGSKSKKRRKTASARDTELSASLAERARDGHQAISPSTRAV